jgi:hypothetical protein
VAREFYVFGEFIVKVRGGTVEDENGNDQAELGLTTDKVRVFPVYHHQDVYTDDYGPNVPVETLWGMSEARIFMDLVHYDTDVLDQCMALAAGVDESLTPLYPDELDGLAGPAGRPMGAGLPLYDANNNYLSVYLIPANFLSAKRPYRFKACYIDSRPLEIPLGTERTMVRLSWRCIPYRTCMSGEITSTNGTLLWDHEFY